MTLSKNTRITSIDILRGVVIIIMALDHIRDYFHAPAYLYDPLDLSQTSAPIFLTRWITHFCAPVFVFLAGTSAYQVGLRKGKKELAGFLLKRGIWLIVLELTIINFAWFFNPAFSFIPLTVIWALGVSMITLSLFVFLPLPWILFIGGAMVLGHNALDSIHFTDNGGTAFLWAVLHEQRIFEFVPGRFVFTGYALLPWTGVMALGYCLGSFYTPATDPAKRKQILIRLGLSVTLFFLVLRFINVYGDPKIWAIQETPIFTWLSFLNVTKYPPSLLYLTVTLGPALLFLAFTENLGGKVASTLQIFGRVPMFYYIIHLFVIHIIALFAALLTGFDASDMVFNTWITQSPNLIGYGFGLIVVYALWIIINTCLYPACRWFDSYKRAHKDQWWVSYM